MGTITRRAQTFSATLEHFENVLTCWVSNISQRPRINVWIFCDSAEIFFGPTSQRQRYIEKNPKNPPFDRKGICIRRPETRKTTLKKSREKLK
jgi:hypothetical protein